MTGFVLAVGLVVGSFANANEPANTMATHHTATLNGFSISPPFPLKFDKLKRRFSMFFRRNMRG